jgi:hypothetical protein
MTFAHSDIGNVDRPNLIGMVNLKVSQKVRIDFVL